MIRLATGLFIVCLIAAVASQDNDGSPSEKPNAPSADEANPYQVCTLPSGDDGECVPFYLCLNNTINDAGVGVIDIRIMDECEASMDTCCSASEKTTEPITPPPSKESKPGCGFRFSDGVGVRIIGDDDNEAQFGEFPWMVAILRDDNTTAGNKDGEIFKCGGSLIHPQVVLTAAHCVTKSGKVAPKLKIRAGEWDTQTENELFPHQDRNVKKIVKHKKYYAGALFNDIALLFLESPVDELDNIGVICLPPAAEIAPAAECIATGWGKDVYGKEGIFQVILKKVDLPIVERSECQKALRKTRLGHRFELHRSFVCAGGEKGKDTCKGDGGSPLVCPMQDDSGRYMQSGIVSWGIGCGDTGTPGVYTNVAILREWIDTELLAENIVLPTYET